MIRLVISGIEMPLLTTPILKLSLSRSLVSAVDSAKITVTNPPVSVLPLAEREAYIYDGTSIVFGGIIRSAPISRPNPQVVTYNIQIDSWEAILNRKIHAGVFSGSVKDNVTSILSDTGILGFINSIDSSLITGKIMIEGTVLDILTEFAAVNKALFYVTPLKEIVMRRDPVDSGIIYNTNTASSFKDTVFNPTSTQLVSVVKVRSARILSQTRVTDAVLIADGVSDIYHINYQYQGITVETSPDGYTWSLLKSGVEYIDNDAECDVLYNFQSFYLRFPTLPYEGIHIRVSGHAYYDFFTDFRDEDVISYLATLTGGDGIYEYLATANEVEGLKSGQDVLNYCRKIIEDRKNVKISGKLIKETSSSLSDPIGKTILVNHSGYNINNSRFIISKYTCSYSRPMWIYTFHLDTALFGIEYVLSTLLKKKSSITNTEALSMARSYTEVIGIEESVQSNIYPMQTFNFDNQFGHASFG